MTIFINVDDDNDGDDGDNDDGSFDDDDDHHNEGSLNIYKYIYTFLLVRSTLSGWIPHIA
jgi:hypothetical protein